MEETEVGVDHGDVVLVTGFHHGLVVGAASRRRHVLHATLVSAIDVVAEWKESI